MPIHIPPPATPLPSCLGPGPPVRDLLGLAHAREEMWPQLRLHYVRAQKVPAAPWAGPSPHYTPGRLGCAGFTWMVDRLWSCPSDLSWHTHGRPEEPSSSVIRGHFYLSWVPGTGLDDTSSTLAAMSVGCFPNTHLHCRQQKESWASVTHGVFPLGWQAICSFSPWGSKSLTQCS